MTTGRALLSRLVVTLVVALVVVGLAAIAPLLAPSPGGSEVDAGPEQSEWEPDRIAPQRLEDGGTAAPSGDVGVVLFDRGHENRFENEDIAPLVEAINEAGGEVRFSDFAGPIGPTLADVDVLVVLDPSDPYTKDEVNEVEQFVEDGGRVLMAGEPNRKEVQQTGFFAALVTERSELTELGSPFGISFGSEYLYDMQHNDGNFKNVVTSPPQRTDAAAVEGVETVSMYTAATVSVNRGTVLLRTADTAERGSDDTRAGFPVAVLTRNGRVMALGDKTFLNDQYAAVADNDLFVQRIVEFMTEADHRPSNLDNGTGASVAPTD